MYLSAFVRRVVITIIACTLALNGEVDKLSPAMIAPSKP